jgi:DNA-binding response OmpR family regulator
MKILIVEDDESLGPVVDEILQAIGYRTAWVRDGQQAMTWLANDVPDAVVLDMHLPHISGITILNHIRNDSRLTKTRVLAVTADNLVAPLIQDQADATFLKPFSVADFVGMISRLAPLG